MRKLFYTRLALSNIRRNRKFYFPYMLTCIFTIAMYYIICALNGLCAVAFGAIMMIAANDAPMGLSELVPLIQTMPLPAFMTENLFWPGLALLLVNGVANLVATALFFSRPSAARRWALAAGALLICWCAFEMLYFPNAASIIYLIVGLAQTALSIGLVRR